MAASKCKGVTKKGTPCNNLAIIGTQGCHHHWIEIVTDTQQLPAYEPPPDWFELYGVSAFKCPHCGALTELGNV